MTKRIIGLVLALCLIVGLLPMIAIADDPEVTSTLTVTTGDNTTPVQWEPTLSEGMAPAYAKTTAEGALVLTGATETDYNLKVEWETGKTPVLTMNGATLANDTHHMSDSDPSVRHTIRIGGNAAFTIMLKGTNVINGNLLQKEEGKTDVANHRMPAGIYAANKAALTIKSVNKTTDTLLIDNNGGNGIYNAYDALTIENANVTIYMETTKSNGQNAIVMAYTSAGYEDKTNLTVIGSILEVKGIGRYYGNNAIVMGQTGAYKAENTGDILFKNSKVILNRNNGTSANSNDAQFVKFGPNSTVTIDRCDFELYGNHRAVSYVPAFKNCTYIEYRTDWGTWNTVTLDPGTKLTAEHNSAIKATHVCGSDADDKDCTTITTCDMCGNNVGTAQTAHTPKADDGDCTTAIYCANEGCEQIVTPAAASHTPAADDSDCTTAINCTVCGKETTPAVPHTPADRANCNVAANCTVCGKEALAAGQHSGGTATCQAKAKCEECGEEYGELAPCAGGTATCTEKAKCATCNLPYGELAAHTGGTATCKDQAKCEVCNQPYGELSTEHVPGEDDKDCSTPVACTLCGGVAIAAKEHKFTNSIDTACDNEGCEHTRVVEPKPDFKISFATAKGGGVPSSTGYATLTMKAGDPTKYYITGNFDATAPNDYFCQELKDATKIAAGEWNMKIEYDADGIPTVTLKKAFIQNKGALQFGGWYAPYEGPAKLIIEEDSIINSGYGYKSTLRFTTKGQNDDVTITSVNNAKLTLISNTLNKDEAAIKACGNLTLDNANIECILTEYNGIANGVCVLGGNLTIKGGTLKIHAWDDPSKTGTNKEGEEANYLLNANACYAGFKVTKDDENEAKAGNVTIEGGANVYLAISVSSNAADAEKRLIATDGVFTIKDSTVEMGLIGKCVDGAKLFSVKPTLEFANNAYTVTATKTTKPSVTATAHELDQWARTIVMTPKADKVVDWASTTSLGSITYFKVVPGGNGGNGTVSGGGTTGGTNDNTGDISILLTAAVTLSSAVGFAGVTVLRKKEF